MRGPAIVDGIVHLVGGWRGGGGIVGQTEEDYRVLERSFTALRYVSRAFWHDLVDLDRRPHRDRVVDDGRVPDRRQRELHGRQGRERVVDALARAGLRPRPVDPIGALQPREPGGGAAVIFRVRSLAGLEDELAASVVGLWRADAAALNGSVDGTRRARLTSPAGADDTARAVDAVLRVGRVGSVSSFCP